MDDIHFELFVLESRSIFGVQAQDVFWRICDLITQSTGQSESAIAHLNCFYQCTKMCASTQHTTGPDSVVTDLADYYHHNERKLNCMIHSSGPERMYMVNSYDG